MRRPIGLYHGRLLEAADSWHHRMRNLYTHQHEGWLDVSGNYAGAGYYFRSTVYRFLVLSSLARRFEAKVFFIDGRIAHPEASRIRKRRSGLAGGSRAGRASAPGVPSDSPLDADTRVRNDARRSCGM